MIIKKFWTISDNFFQSCKFATANYKQKSICRTHLNFVAGQADAGVSAGASVLLMYCSRALRSCTGVTLWLISPPMA